VLQLNRISVPKSLPQRDEENQKPTTALESQPHPFLANMSSDRVLTALVKHDFRLP
jgi:hypothetical protein